MDFVRLIGGDAVLFDEIVPDRHFPFQLLTGRYRSRWDRIESLLDHPRFQCRVVQCGIERGIKLIDDWHWRAGGRKDDEPSSKL